MNTFEVDLAGNLIAIHVNQCKVRALLDTGASVSCISLKAIEKFFKSNVELQSCDISKVTGVGGHLIPVLGQLSLTVNIGNITVQHTFRVLENMNYPVILGLDFLQSQKATVCYASNKLKMRDGQVSINMFKVPDQIVMKSISHCCIPPRTESLIAINTNDIIIPNQPYLLQPLSTLSKTSGLIGATSVTITKEGHTNFRIFNPHFESISIRAGQKVASLDRLNDNDIHAWSDEVSVNSCKHDSCTFDKTDDELIAIANELGFVNPNPNLTPEQSRDLMILIGKHRDIFATNLKELGSSNVHEHFIDTGTASPIRLPPYRASPVKRAEIEKQIELMKDADLIEDSVSPWQAPVVLITKKDGSFRFAVDYRKLNQVTKPLHQPLPHIEDVFDTIGQNKAAIFSTLDCASGFWQIPLDKRTAHKTAFVTHQGVYQFKRLPFGMMNAPSVFAMVMNHILRNLSTKYAMVYVDDILVFSKDFTQHLQHLSEIFHRLRQANLRLKPEKCNFAMPKVTYLGHMISGNGVEMERAKLDKVINYPTPTNLKAVRSFLGLCNYYRRFVKSFADVARPLNDLMKKNVNFQWTNDCHNAFQALKDKLTSEPVVLKFPDYERQFILYTDASDFAIGYVLGQKASDNKEHVIAYSGRSLTKTERNWPVHEKECLAVVEGIRHFRTYLEGNNQFLVYTDHKGLEALFDAKQNKSPKLLRYSIELQGFNCKIVYRPGKCNGNADALSRIEHVYDITYAFPTPPRIPSHTVNALQAFANSQDAYRMADPITLICELSTVTPKSLSELQKEDEHFGPIYSYLQDKTQLPADVKEAHRVVVESLDCSLEDSILYHHYAPRGKGKRIDRLIRQVAIPYSLRDDVLRSYHDSLAGGGHQGEERCLEAIRLKYFWPNMASDIKEYVKSCLTCQQSKRHIHAHPAPLHPIPPEEIFSRWHMDILGPLHKAHDGSQYILLFVDSFSKWCEAFPLKTQTAAEVAKHLYHDIICRYGAPRKLVSDRGSNFMSTLIKELCKLFQVVKVETSSYHPQANSTCERMNSVIGATLRAYTDENQSIWPDIIPSIMMSYRAFPSTQSTKHSPFFLLYGMECNLPIDTALLPQNSLTKTTDQHMQTVHKNLITARTLAKENQLAAQEKNSSTHDRKARLPRYQVGQRVWLFCSKTPKGKSAKLVKRWIGPYYICHSSDTHTYKLASCNTHRLVRSRIHANRLKPYFDPANRPTNPALDEAIDRTTTPSLPQPTPTTQSQQREITPSIPASPIPHSTTQSTEQHSQSSTHFTPTSQSNTQNADEPQTQSSQFRPNHPIFQQIDRLIKKRKNKDGLPIYRVKWKGQMAPSWELASHIPDHLIEEFHIKRTNQGKLRKYRK